MATNRLAIAVGLPVLPQPHRLAHGVALRGFVLESIGATLNAAAEATASDDWIPPAHSSAPSALRRDVLAFRNASEAADRPAAVLGVEMPQPEIRVAPATQYAPDTQAFAAGVKLLADAAEAKVAAPLVGLDLGEVIADGRAVQDAGG